MVTRQSILTIGSKLKKGTRVVAGVALSAGMLATFALPAYAAPSIDGAPDLVPAQQLTTVNVDTPLAIELPQATTADEIAVEQRRQADEAAASVAAERVAAGKTPERPSMGMGDIPAGSGASGVLAGAYAQLGWNQDCTDLVQNALAAAGMTTSRLDGGYDMGITDFRRFGTPVASGNYAPGDILIWPGQHVAIYAGNGQAVHGGWGGNQTVVNTAWSPSSTPEVIRIG
jgi:cell wall-associated NlpC family hydrolase